MPQRSRPPLHLVFAAVLPLPGCLLYQAERAAEAGDFLESAELYEAAYRCQGFDFAKRRCDHVRDLAIEDALHQIDVDRRAGRSGIALAQLHDLRQLVLQWKHEVSIHQEAAIEEQITLVAEEDLHVSLGRLRQGYPLGARQALPEQLGFGLHPAYVHVRTETIAAIDLAGAQRCHELSTAAASSTSSRVPDMAAMYCREFHEDPRPSTIPVAACDRMTTRFRNPGLSEQDQRLLAAEANRLLAATPFLHPRGDCVLEVEVEATRTLDTKWKATAEIAEWTVSIPYTAREQKTEYYTRFDSSEQSLPMDIGSGTPVHMRVVTPVTTSLQVWVDVTRYRSESRSQVYPAKRITHIFEGSGSFLVTVPATGVVFTVPWSSRYVEAGLEHRTYIPAAGVSASSVPEPAHAKLVDVDHQALRKAWATALPLRLEPALCHGGGDLDLAIACMVYVGPEALSSEARDAVTDALGESIEAVAWMVSKRKSVFAVQATPHAASR